MTRILFLVCVGSAVVLAACAGSASPDVAAEARGFGLWSLFRQSFDLFTILLIVGSVVALAVVFSCLIDLRASKILPEVSVNTIADLAGHGRWEELRAFVGTDESYVGRVVRAAMAAARVGDRDSVRETAELAAAEESARWFRRIEVVNVIGKLGPLIGLAGTVWGMILAFTSLGAAGGMVGANELSLGISKALFHSSVACFRYSS